MDLNQERLINNLISRPNTEREFGYNDAIIDLLKNSRPETEEAKLAQALGQWNRHLSSGEMRTIIEHKQSNNKLHAVKLLKDITGLGLKEAKDLLDVYFVL